MVLILCLACNRDEDITLEIGEDFVNSDTKVYYIDTLTTLTSTFKFDSIPVASPSRFLIGSYDDPIFGNVNSKSFLQLANNSGYTIDNEAVFDSIAVILEYDNYFYNDTTTVQQFSIHEIIEDIKPDDDTYYNTSNFDFDNTPIAIRDFIARPNEPDSLHILLNQNFGLELFNKIQENDINNNDELINEYQGLLIQPSTNNSCILGFTTNSLVRMYYSIPNESNNDERFFDFSFNITNSFNQTKSNPQGTYFENIVDVESDLPSIDTDNTSFIQSGNAIATKIDIPYIERIYDIEGSGTIINANLKISLKKNSFSDNLHTRDSLQVFILNHNSEIIAPLTNFSVIAQATLDTENTEFGEKTYIIPIKDFLEQKLDDDTFQDLFLAIYSVNFDNSVDRYILNGEASEDDDEKVKLELTYAIYDDE